MAYTLTNLQAILGYSGRNANSSAMYPNVRRDWALQLAMQLWARLTRTPRQLNTVTLTTGSATVPALPSGFLPEFLIEGYLTLSGAVIPPGITFTTIETVLKSQYDGTSYPVTPYLQTPPTSPRTGVPTLIGALSQTTYILNTLCDQAYTLNLYWRAPLTLWTPGSTGPTFNLPDDALLAIASLGAVYYLQRGEPANKEFAKDCLKDFNAEAIRFAARNAGGLAPQTLVRDQMLTRDGGIVNVGT